MSNHKKKQAVHKNEVVTAASPAKMKLNSAKPNTYVPQKWIIPLTPNIWGGQKTSKSKGKKKSPHMADTIEAPHFKPHNATHVVQVNIVPTLECQIFILMTYYHMRTW